MRQIFEANVRRFGGKQVKILVTGANGYLGQGIVKQILEDRHEFPTCKVWGKKIEKKIIGISDTYPSTCSKKCKYIFIKNNIVNKYGVKNVSQLNSVKQKK